MPDHEEHCQHSWKRYGVRGDDVHSFIDEPSKTVGKGHRQFRHDSNTVKLVGEIFGPEYGREIAENIALDHIMADHEEEVKNRNSNTTVNAAPTAGRVPYASTLRVWNKFDFNQLEHPTNPAHVEQPVEGTPEEAKNPREEPRVGGPLPMSSQVKVELQFNPSYFGNIDGLKQSRWYDRFWKREHPPRTSSAAHAADNPRLQQRFAPPKKPSKISSVKGRHYVAGAISLFICLPAFIACMVLVALFNFNGLSVWLSILGFGISGWFLFGYATEWKALKSKKRERQPSAKLRYHNPARDTKEKWQCLNCGKENDGDSDTCELCSAMRDTTYSSSGATLENDYGGDDLWDDEQGLM